MKSKLPVSSLFCRLFISLTLASGLAACGGDSSSSRSSTPQPVRDVPLDEAAWPVLVGNSISILVEDFEMPKSLARLGTEVSGLFSECAPDQYDLKTSATAISVHYDCETTYQYDDAPTPGAAYSEREQERYSITGKVTLSEVDSDSGEASFENLLVELHYLFESWDTPGDGTLPPDSVSRFTTRIFNHGHIAWQARTPYAVNLTSDVEMTASSTGQPTESNKLRYSVRDLSASGDMLSFFLTLHQADGDIAARLETLQPLIVARWDACPEVGQLEWTDAAGNVLNVLFGGAHDVVMTLNGVANPPLTCEEYEAAIKNALTP